MAPQSSEKKQKISAIINIIAGLLFLGAAFGVLTGEAGVNWMWLILSVLFAGAGIWGLAKSPK
jgi:predicted branched-subunit amino acid permease